MNKTSQFAKQDEILAWDKCTAFQFWSIYGKLSPNSKNLKNRFQGKCLGGLENWH